MAYPTKKDVLFMCVIFFGYKALGCDEGCIECSGISQFCSKCGVGYWLYQDKCRQCPVNCLQCYTDTRCTNCSEQFWNISSFCSKSCPTSCNDNGCDDVTGHCFGCMPGFYGSTCVQNCSLCTDGLCDFSDGHCLNGCIAEYYENTEIFVNAKCLKCSNNCSRCQSQGICDACDTGYFKLTYEVANNKTLTFCYPCPPTCKECITSDNCTVCKSGTYGQICQNSCTDTNCHACLEVNRTDICTECTDGYIFNGPACVPESTCSSNCFNGCDGNYHCKAGCKDGWSGKRCVTKCATPCLKCDEINSTLCTQCKEDFYTGTCTVACNEHCLRGMGKQTCSQKDGFCLNGCIDGYWGVNCDKACHSGCKRPNCNQLNGSCTPCHDWSYGAFCQYNCSGQCNMINDSANVCDKTNGTCLYGCNIGLWGYICNETCSIGCISSTCKQSNGSCEACRPEFYGPSCENNCSEHCIVPTDSTRICDSIDGTCSSGCTDGYNGNRCDIEKSDSHSESTETTTIGETAAESKESDDDTGMIIAGAGGGVVVLISGATVVICVVIRKRQNKGKRTDCLPDEEKQRGKVPESDTYYNIAGLLKSRINTSDLPVYVKDKVDEFDTEFKKLPSGLTRTCKEALKPHNRAKNRYNGIYAYDATRVKLHSKNYINANYIEGYQKSHVSYIASLGPTRATMDNFKIFWEMIWQENSNKIIMLTNINEEQIMKCEQYWPDQNCRKMYGDFEVSCLAENVYPEFVIRELSIKLNSDTRQVTQYQYTAWPDKSVPDNKAPLVAFRDKVEQGQNHETGPFVVHCSAGIGRTGAYIALDILIREGKEENSVDIFGCVMALRGQRVNLVQNVEQYAFLHSFVLYALTRDEESS